MKGYLRDVTKRRLTRHAGLGDGRLVGAIAATLAARQTTEKAGVAANALRALQQDARIFLQIDLEVMTIEDARTTLQSLIDRQQQLSREAVIPSTRAWNRAKKQIEGGAQTYESEKT